MNGFQAPRTEGSPGTAIVCCPWATEQRGKGPYFTFLAEQSGFKTRTQNKIVQVVKTAEKAFIYIQFYSYEFWSQVI